MPKFIWPVPGYYAVSSGYADQRDYGLHGAIDIPAPAVPTVAVGSGRVIFFGWAGNAGRSVYVVLDNGYRVHYCHLSHLSVDPITGRVTAGDVIGLVGGSGFKVDDYYGSHLHINLFAPTAPSTGPSHWVAWVGMYAVDPELYLGKEDDDMSVLEEHQKILNNLWDRMAGAEQAIGTLQKEIVALRAQVASSGGVSENRVKAIIRAARLSV